MKNVKRYFLSFLAALSIVLLALGAVKTFAVTDTEGNTPGANDKYDIVLTKVKLQDLSGWPSQKGKDNTDYTGQKLNNIQSYFGAGAETLEGVWFEVHKYDSSKTGNIGALVQEGKTDAAGQITFKDLPAGKYMIVENKEKSTLASKEQLAKSAAVPMEITLPVFKATGGWYKKGTEAVHVYPKNTVDKPSIDKVVNERDKHDTANVGEKKNFKVTSKMPEGIADYKVLTYTDTFSAGLSYAGNLKVQKNNVDIDPSSYTLTEPAVGDKGATIKVEFKADYIKTLTSSDTIKITYDATINENAVMGQANKNDVKVTYGTNPTVTKEGKPDENPELHTGGAKFVKKDQTTKAALKAAEFKVTNTEGKYLKQTVSNGKVVKNEWVSSQNDGTVIKSNNNGEFEVKGLPYGTAGNKNTEGSTTYKLVETKAPTGYALLQQPVEFTISSTTYTGKVNQVNNNKVTIPQTGGIGSALVIAAGVLVVGLGFIAKRRSAK